MAAQPVTTDMSEADRYFFDLNGWMRVPGVLSPGEVDVCNAAIDAHATAANSISRAGRPAADALAGDASTESHRVDQFGFLAWPAPAGDVFRSILAHPKLVPCLDTL